MIDYRPDYVRFEVKEWYMPRATAKEWAKLLLQRNARHRAIERHKMFEAFSRDYIPLTATVYDSLATLRSDAPTADIYIAGSDQIWNTLFPNGSDAAYYLAFGRETTRRASYAASFATTTLRDGTAAQVKAYLQNIDHISVREASGVKILASLGLAGQVVVDPVFLLSAKEWDVVLPDVEPQEKYILVYDMMRCNDIRRIAQRLARCYGCKIYSVSPYVYHYADKNFLCATPLMFVALIKHAQCLLSNSFHGTAFALLYRRNFFVVERKDGLNDRMAALLERYNLQSRMVDATAADHILEERISYAPVSAALQRDIQASQDYLNMVCA